MPGLCEPLGRIPLKLEIAVLSDASGLLLPMGHSGKNQTLTLTTFLNSGLHLKPTIGLQV